MTRRKPAIDGTIEPSASLSRCGSLVVVRLFTAEADQPAEPDKAQARRRRYAYESKRPDLVRLQGPRGLRHEFSLEALADIVDSRARNETYLSIAKRFGFSKAGVLAAHKRELARGAK